MKKIQLLLLLALGAIAAGAQQFSIQGKIKRLSHSKNMLLSGFDPAPIQADGSFRITGTINGSRVALIRTDSSGADGIWLTPGEYTLNCEETRTEGISGVLFRTPKLEGPGDARLYNSFQQQQYTGFGITALKNEERSSFLKRQQERSFQYLDSILNKNNNAPVLANMVRSAQFYVGDEGTKRLIEKLSPELRKNDEIALLDKDFKRKDKIAAEKQFERFTMKDTAGNDVALSSVKGKKAILLDFWASDCGPCRATHPRLIKWYQKYKDRGFEIISISIDTEKEKWTDAIKADGIEKWINISELKGWETSLMKNYFISFIPFKFLLDGQMNIIKTENMATAWIEEKDITALLDQQ